MTHSTACADETERLGHELAASLHAGDLILLSGDLAAGKTTFTRGLVRGLDGEPSEVSSPTFVIVQSYPCACREIAVVHHVDLYRLQGDPAELREIGIEELLSEPDAVTAVEWPRDRLLDWLPRDVRLWRVHITILDDDTREVEIVQDHP